MSDGTTRDETVTGQHRALSAREEVLGAVIRLEERVSVVERDLRAAQDHHRDRDRGARTLWMTAVGLLITMAITVVSGLIVWNGQLSRVEERVDALRAQVQALVAQVQVGQQQNRPPRWSQP